MPGHALKSGPCEPMDGILGVSVENRGRYRYPDLGVFCGGIEIRRTGGAS